MDKTSVTKKKRLNFKDDFEMLYLRHEYIERVRELGKEFDSTMVKRYAGIVHTTARVMFAKLKPIFYKVGFDEEDFVSITNMYMLSYMALYSIQTNPKELQHVLEKKGVGSLEESEILRIDRNNLINFLRQRLYHCSLLFSRKARSITAGEDRRGIFAATKDSVGVCQELLLEDHQKYGYRKVTSKEFKKAKEISKASGDSDLFDKDGFRIQKIVHPNPGISEYDYVTLLEQNKGSYYQNPEATKQAKEEEVALEAFQIKVGNMDEEAKKKLLRNFIRKNKDNKSLRKELRLAKKMLSSKNTKIVVV